MMSSCGKYRMVSAGSRVSCQELDNTFDTALGCPERFVREPVCQEHPHITPRGFIEPLERLVIDEVVREEGNVLNVVGDRWLGKARLSQPSMKAIKQGLV